MKLEDILKSSFVKYLTIATIAVLIFSTIFKNFSKDYFKEDVNSKTDTLYIDRYLKGLPEYKFITLPGKVYFFKSKEGSKVDSVILRDSTIYLLHVDTLVTEVKTSFLTLYPQHPKLIQFDLTNKRLRLDLFNRDGIEYREEYTMNLERNNYRYVNNHLTIKPKLVSRFDINAEYYIRPMVNMHDLNLNLSLKTGQITYIGGLSLYYYPNINNSINLTPILGIRYTP